MCIRDRGEVIVEAGTALETVTTTADGSVQFDMDLPIVEAVITSDSDEVDPDFSQTVIDGYRIVEMCIRDRVRRSNRLRVTITCGRGGTGRRTRLRI